MMFLPRGRRGLPTRSAAFPGIAACTTWSRASDIRDFPRAGVAIGDHAADSHLHSRHRVMSRRSVGRVDHQPASRGGLLTASTRTGGVRRADRDRFQTFATRGDIEAHLLALGEARHA